MIQADGFDLELRAKFFASAGRRLAQVREALERLQLQPGDAALAKRAAREIHILKGDAKLLGIEEIFSGAQVLEEKLERARSDGFSADSESMGLLLAGLTKAERFIADGPPAHAHATAASGGPRGRLGIRSDGHGWRILLIDDSEIALEAERSTLANEGFDVRGTTTVNAFDELLKDWSPQVILADVDMPAMSGPELCRALKRHYDTAHVPIVLCSALSSDELEKLARECEADGYVSKARLGTLAEELRELCEAMAW